MANDLEVNASGLRMAAAGSGDAATAFVNGVVDASSSARPSTAAISALDVAISTVRRRQSGRIAAQAGDLSTGAARYGETDGDAARTVIVTV